MLQVVSGLWTYPLSAQPAFPQLGKWSHVTGCAPVHVLSQVCAQVLARTATPRLVGTPQASWYGPGAGRGLAPGRMSALPPGGEGAVLPRPGQALGGAPGDRNVLLAAEGPRSCEWGVHGTVCLLLCLGRWGSWALGPLCLNLHS